MTLGAKLGHRIDGLLSSFFPTWALKRQVARIRLNAMAVHRAAHIDRTTSDWSREGYSPDQANLPELYDITARARAAVRDDWAAASIVKAFRRNVVGIGITPRAAAIGPDGDLLTDFNEKVDRNWRRWARNPQAVDAEGRKSFNAMMRLCVCEAVTSGQAFVIMGYQERKRSVGLTLQMFEVEQLAREKDTVGIWGGLPPKGQNEIRGGVEIDRQGKPVAYWVHLGGHPYERSYSQVLTPPKRIPAERVLHFGPQSRPRETLAVTRMAPVLRNIWDRGGYENNEQLAKKIESFLGIAIERNSKFADSGPIGFAPEGNEYGEVGDSPDAGGNRQINFQPGSVPVLYEGEKINPFHFDRPGANYGIYMDRTTGSIAAGVDLSGSRLNRKVSSSYSAGRQEDLEDNKTFDIDQQDLIDNIIRPIRERFVLLGIMEGRFQAPGFFHDPDRMEDYLETDFQTPPRPPADPAKEAAAIKILIDYGIANHAEILNRYGRDWRDNAKTISQIIQLYEKLGIPMPWLNPNGTPSDPKVHGTGDRPGNNAGAGEPSRTQSRGSLAAVIIDWALREEPELAAAVIGDDEHED